MPVFTPRRFRRWLLPALTVVAVAVTARLALEAWRATERHRIAAEASLRDNAGFAALTFRSQAVTRAWLGSDAIFREVGHGRAAAAAGPLPPLRVLRQAAQRFARCGDCGPVLHPSAYFRFVMADSTLEVDGPPLPPARRALLVDLALHLPLRANWRDWDYTSVVDTLAPAPALVYLTERRDLDGRPLALYGFIASLDDVAAALLRPPLEMLPLLPLPRGSTLTNDSLLSVTLTRPDGRVALDLSPRRHPDTYAASIPASRLFGGLTLRVALDPATAPRLLAGGLPRARPPLLAALVLAATLLILATIAVAWRALELAELRADFVASVSHELRTPLAQILLFGESLTVGTMRARRDVRVAGGVIVGEARRLLQLVDNVLQLGRQTRAAGSPASPVPLAPLVRDVAAGFEAVASSLESRVMIGRLDDVVAPADPDAIRQVLINLLDNALKYGPRGQTVTLGVALAGASARLWVEDQGPGIPPRDRTRVWRPFVRLERDMERQASGSGLGLSLVREIVARHRGTTAIEATPAGGARVVVELPEARAMRAEETSCTS
jgi:signal transduction histidine kinase